MKIWIKVNIAVTVGAGFILADGTTHLAAETSPQTPEELNGWYMEPPAGQNAATFNLQGVKAMQIAGASQNPNLAILGKLPTPEPSAALPPAVKTALADFLQRNQEALQLLAQGAQHEQSRYPIDLSKGPATLLPHLQGVRRAAQLCQMAAILDAENGSGKKAGDDVAMALALARSLKAEPVLMSQLVRFADIALAVAALNQSVNHATLPPESLHALAKMFRDTEDYDARGEGLNRALVGEKVAHMAFLKDQNELLRILQTDAANGDEQSRRAIEYVKQNPDLRAEQDYTESAFQQLMAARQDPFPERLKSVSDVIHNGVSQARNQGLLLDAMEWATFDNLAAREARNVAHLRLAMTAIALEQFRASHSKRYPDALSELVPSCLDAPLMTPFDGKPLHYRKEGAGYVLYSIGPDLRDGGNRTKDLVFTVAAPPAN